MYEHGIVLIWSWKLILISFKPLNSIRHDWLMLVMNLSEVAVIQTLRWCLKPSSIHHNYFINHTSNDTTIKVENKEAVFIRFLKCVDVFHLLRIYCFVLLLCLLSSSLLLGKHLVHVGYWKEGNNLLVVGLPAERYRDTVSLHKLTVLQWDMHNGQQVLRCLLQASP